MSEPLPIERFADLSAEIEVTGDKEGILSRETLPPETWERTKAHWLRVMADEAERRRLKVSVRYQNHFIVKRKLYEARARRAPIEDKLAAVVAPAIDAATPALTGALVSSAEQVNAPQPPRVEAPPMPRPAVVSGARIEHAPPLGFDVPSVPAVRTAQMPATPVPAAPVRIASTPAAPAAQRGPSPAPPPRRVWSTMITDGMPSAQPATPFRTSSETAVPAQSPARAPGPPPAPPPPAPSRPRTAPPPAPSPSPPETARPAAAAAPMASPPRDPKLAGTVTFDLDEMLGQAALAGERVGTGTGPLPPGRSNVGLPFDRSAPPPAPPPPAPPPPGPPQAGPSSPAPPAVVPRGREPIPEHLQATSAVDLSQIIQAITPFAGKQPSSPPAPQRIPTPPGSTSGLPFGGPSPRPSQPVAEPARARPAAAFGTTSFADPFTSSSPATPFAEKVSPPTAKLQIGPPRLSINVFASIAAEIAESPSEVEAILRKYAMDKDDHLEESMRWEAEFERNADMRLRYGGIVARYRGYIAQRKGK